MSDHMYSTFVLYVGKHSVPQAQLSPQANWLKSEGVKKGDCVTIYLPMVRECCSRATQQVATTMLLCKSIPGLLPAGAVCGTCQGRGAWTRAAFPYLLSSWTLGC